MPMTKEQQEAFKAWNDNSQNFMKAAKKLGIPRSTLRDRVVAAQKWIEAPDGQKKAVDAAGLSITGAKHGWRKIKNDDGTADSVFWKADNKEIDPQDLREVIQDALQDIKPPKIKVHAGQVDKEMLTVYPIADLHIGLLCDEEEVGVNWDTKIALTVFKETLGNLVARTPKSHTAILAQLGDLTHTDDQQNVTPQSKHQLDVDSRYFMIVRRALEAMKWAIELLRQKHERVIYRGSRGNHDMTTHIAITVALAEHYRDAEDVIIVQDAQDFYTHEFGKNLFILHHGDKAKPERLLPFIASEFAEAWGRTRHRVTFSGHVHHEWVKEMSGMLFRSVGTIIPRDVHAYSHAYGSSRCLMAFVYHETSGEIASLREPVPEGV